MENDEFLEAGVRFDEIHAAVPRPVHQADAAVGPRQVSVVAQEDGLAGDGLDQADVDVAEKVGFATLGSVRWEGAGGKVLATYCCRPRELLLIETSHWYLLFFLR